MTACLDILWPCETNEWIMQNVKIPSENFCTEMKTGNSTGGD